MSCLKYDSDSSDGEIFVEKQIKPVNKLTIQEALIIKHTVLNTLQTKKESKTNKKNPKTCSLNVNETKTSKKLSNGAACDKTTKKKCIKPIKSENSSNSSSNNCLNKVKIECELIEEEIAEVLCSKTEKPVVKDINIPKSKENLFEIFKSSPERKTVVKSDNESIQLSPGISRKKRKFNITNSPNSKSPKQRIVKNKRFSGPSAGVQSRKNLMNIFDSEPSSASNGNIKNDFIKSEKDLESEGTVEGDTVQISDYNAILNMCRDLDETKFINNNSELFSFFLKKIIHDEIKKQIDLQIQSAKDGKIMEKLLSEKECEILEKFFHISETASKVYVRLLCRKNCWRKVSSISYNDISQNLQDEFSLLNSLGFVDTNIEEEDLRTQLDLLSKSEVQILCKTFNVSKTSGTSKKQELISSLIQNTKTQKSVINFMNKKNAISRSNLLASEVLKCLGMCIRLNKIAFSAFRKVLILFSFPHYFGEEEKRFSEQLFLLLRVYKHGMKFPLYRTTPTVVFQTFSDFDKYEKALLVREAFEIAIENKEVHEFQSIANASSCKFKELIIDEEYAKRVMSLDPYLQKFNAGAIYGKILTRYCKLFKKNTDPRDIINVSKMLLEQNLLLKDKRGEWYEILSKALLSIKDNNEAAKVLIQSQSDPFVNEVQKLTLQLRGQGVLKRKTNIVYETSLREHLDDVCTISVQEPCSIEIRGKAVEGNKSGFKSIYIEENENGKRYTSVEERAISYYKSIGFTNGYHVEGDIILSIYFLLFFDIVYGESPPGVFQSPFQEAPLDLYSENFYLNRKQKIDSYIQEMKNWNMSQVETKLKDVYSKNYETTCVIPWRDHFTPEFFCDIIQCITMPVLALICQRFVQNLRVTRSGFPDLTLWNSQTKKCKFVEVKSPKDTLSPAQRLWLDYLRSIGVDCEVCNVKNTSSKIFS